MDRVNHSLSNIFLKKSVLVYTLHKSGSTLFSRLLFPHCFRLSHSDIDSNIYNAHSISSALCSLNFETRGQIYGPIRVSSFGTSDEWREYHKIILKSNFFHQFRKLIVIRDPRDIIVSAYYSFGQTHELSKHESIRSSQIAMRSKIESLSIDDFALYYAEVLKSSLKILIDIKESKGPRCYLLRYEDLILDWDTFRAELAKVLSVPRGVCQQLYNQSRPRACPDMSAHKRSGKVEQFREELKVATIDRVNHLLREELGYFRYSI